MAEASRHYIGLFYITGFVIMGISYEQNGVVATLRREIHADVRTVVTQTGIVPDSNPLHTPLYVSSRLIATLTTGLIPENRHN